MSTIERWGPDGQLIDRIVLPQSPEQIRRDAAEAALRGIRPIIRAAMQTSQDDLAALGSVSTLLGLRPIVARLLQREQQMLQAMRRLLLVSGADSDDGQE